MIAIYKYIVFFDEQFISFWLQNCYMERCNFIIYFLCTVLNTASINRISKLITVKEPSNLTMNNEQTKLLIYSKANDAVFAYNLKIDGNTSQLSS